MQEPRAIGHDGAREKLSVLGDCLAKMGCVLVAYSGGVDSTFLLWAALEGLGRERVLAATAVSPIVAGRDLERAKKIAGQLGAHHRLAPTDHLADPLFVEDSPRRCYFCRRIILTRLTKVAREANLTWIIEGSNLDDRGEYRPGNQVVQEAGARSPLAEPRPRFTALASTRFTSTRSGRWMPSSMWSGPSSGFICSALSTSAPPPCTSAAAPSSAPTV